MVPPGQKDVSSDAVIFSTSPVPLTSGLFWLIQSDERLTQTDWLDAGVVGTTLMVVGAGVVPCPPAVDWTCDVIVVTILTRKRQRC